MTQRQARLSWLLAAVAVLAVGLFATAQVVAMHSLLTWSPKVGEPAAVSAVLAAPTPDAISAEVDAAALRALPAAARSVVLSTSTDLFDPRALTVVSQDSRVWAVIAGSDVPGAVVTLPADAESLKIGYDGGSNVVSLTAGSAHGEGSPLPARLAQGTSTPITPTVSALSSDKALVGSLTATVTTASLGHQTPGWRVALAVVAVAAIGGVLTIARRRPSEPADAESADRHTPLWTGSDTAVAAVVLAGLLLSLPEFDDGWVLTTVRSFDSLGVFSNYYTIQATAQPQGFWWTSLERLWLDGSETPAFLLRLPAAMILLWSWWFVRRRVIDQIVPFRSLRLARASGACAVVLAVPSLALLLRPEPAVAVLVAVALGLAVRYLRRPDPWVVGALALVAAAALGVHQGGWAVAGICAAMLPTLVGWWRRASRPAAAIFPQLLAAAALLGLLLMLGTNAWLWWRSVQAFSADPGYGGVFEEAATLYPLGAGLGFGAVPSRVMFYGVAIIASLAFLVRSTPQRGRVATGAGAAAALAVIGLALSSSKNPVHAAAVVPAVAVLLAMAASDVLAAARPWSRLITAVCGLAVLTYLGTVTVRVMTPSTQESAGEAAQPWFAGGWLAGVVMAAALVTALAVRRLHRARNQDPSPPGVGAGARSAAVTAAITATIAAGISVLATLGPAAAQAGDPASWVGQNIAALRGQGCGLAGDAAGGVPTAVRPLPTVGGVPALATVAVPTPPIVNPNPLFPAETPPFAETPVLAAPSTPTGWVATDWYSTTGLDTVAIWARARFTGITFDVVFGDDSGAEVSRQQLVRDGEAAPIWLAFRPRIPTGATRVALLWATDSGPVAVTAPAAVTASASVAQLASGRPVWNNPQTHLQAPCVSMPTITDGLISRYEYSVGRPNLNGAGYVSQMRTAQLACPVESRAAAGRCLYRLGPPLLPAANVAAAPETVGWL